MTKYKEIFNFYDKFNQFLHNNYNFIRLEGF